MQRSKPKLATAGGVRATICTPDLSSEVGIGESCNCPVGIDFVIFIVIAFGIGLAVCGRNRGTDNKMQCDNEAGKGREGLEEQAGDESIVGAVHASGAPDAPLLKHQGIFISSLQEEGLYHSGAGEALEGGHHTPGPSSALP